MGFSETVQPNCSRKSIRSSFVLILLNFTFAVSVYSVFITVGSYVGIKATKIRSAATDNATIEKNLIVWALIEYTNSFLFFAEFSFVIVFLLPLSVLKWFLLYLYEVFVWVMICKFKNIVL